MQQQQDRLSCTSELESEPRCAQTSIVEEGIAERLALTFKALSDPTRVRMIAALAQCELCVHDLAAMLEMTQSAVSHQLATLREMDLVKFTRQGRHVYYTLDDDHIYDLFQQGLEHIRHVTSNG